MLIKPSFHQRSRNTTRLCAPCSAPSATKSARRSVPRADVATGWTEGNRSLTPVRAPSHRSVHHPPTWRRVDHIPSDSLKSHCFFSPHNFTFTRNHPGGNTKVCRLAEAQTVLCGLSCVCLLVLKAVYYESIKREPKIRGIKKCRCDERLQTKTKEFTRLPYTGLVLELEHLKIETRLTSETPVSDM